MNNIERHIPLAAFALFASRALYTGLGWQDAMTVLGLASFAFAWKWAGARSQLSDLAGKITEQDQEIKLLKERQDQLNTHISGVKIGAQMRGQGVSR